MLYLYMDKMITVNDLVQVYTIPYEGLGSVLEGVDTFEAKFYNAQSRLRVKQLARLGYSIKQSIVNTDEVPHHTCRLLFTKEEE